MAAPARSILARRAVEGDNDEENRAAYRRAGRIQRHRVFPTGVGRERKGDARRLPESQRAKNAGVEGAIVHYGDDVGYSALFIGGRYPQPFMKTSRAGAVLISARHAEGGGAGGGGD